MEKKIGITDQGGATDGLSHSQKRRVQRLRNLEEAEAQYLYTLRRARPDLAVKIRQIVETKVRPPKKVWRPKQAKADAQEPVEEEIDEPESSLDEKEEEIDELESSLDEKEEESDEQKEEEWISYPCQPSNESNSLSLTLFDCPPCLPKEVECYVPVDSLEILPMSKNCESYYATVIYDNPC
ncbi:hypothetical protein QYE76_020145 [Lolium multiflorum]|uniref:Uncharacterized protein n=1 Tax=Lolium multiflorum TaxID=4521 RepID=A0AAD8VRW5_LOLMU|nr:hypothetical protein QYE76_020145 [Lolium multiflorum]